MPNAMKFDALHYAYASGLSHLFPLFTIIIELVKMLFDAHDISLPLHLHPPLHLAFLQLNFLLCVYKIHTVLSLPPGLE